MAVSSVLSFKDCTSWQGLLLMAFLLTSWHLSTTTNVTIKVVPPYVFEGENVLLLPKNLPDNLLAFVWFKGITEKSHMIAVYAANTKRTVMGRAHSGRETIYSDGSLKICNVTQKDKGFYILKTYNRQAETVSTTSIYLHVYTSPLTCGCPLTSAQPSIELMPPNVAKGGSVLLRVHNLPEKLQALFWYKGVAVFKDKEVYRYVIAKNASVEGPAHSGREIMYSNGSLLVHSVTLKDTGFYTLRTLSTDLKDEVVHVQLLVDASFLPCGHLPTSTQFGIESVPPRVAEGGSVLLLVYNLPKNLRMLFWYKGLVVFKDQEVSRYIIALNSSVEGPAHSGRETVYKNGSLLIHNVTWNDTGFYTLRTLKTDLKDEMAHVQLHVNGSLSTCCNHLTSAPLMIDQVPQNVAKGESVLLHVHNLPQDLQAFYWYKSAYRSQLQKIAEYSSFTNSIIRGPAFSRRMTVYTNGSLLLQNATENDAGFYTLEIVNRGFKIATTHTQLHINSLSACIHPSTTGQLIIEPVPLNIIEGNNTLLLVHNIPEKLQSFSWYKGVAIVNKHKISWNEITTNRSMLGPAHSGRETVYPNGSLLLHNVTQEDTGIYTLRTLNMRFETQETHVQLHIYKPVTQPFIHVTDTTVRVQSSVVFTCLSADPGVSTQWFFNNQELQLTERMTLSPTKCRLSINPVRMEDSGKYKCEISNPVSLKASLPVSLSVMNE
ncbi:carcinoembryonic antigen-related cell adhesion molecule 3-like [Acomys russatus]|uniref:carcinoembryonic antigen-related cell adhesion molecule 3-like n=1 Tax=Acomys russatus TaxID=60746 RepID=UPI0021E1C0E1|nr:carcinoembryonic antigen-related cell adhesion molecule 3-like [Acomys russatus]